LGSGQFCRAALTVCGRTTSTATSAAATPAAGPSLFVTIGGGVCVAVVPVAGGCQIVGCVVPHGPRPLVSIVPVAIVLPVAITAGVAEPDVAGVGQSRLLPTDVLLVAGRILAASSAPATSAPTSTPPPAASLLTRRVAAGLAISFTAVGGRGVDPALTRFGPVLIANPNLVAVSDGGSIPVPVPIPIPVPVTFLYSLVPPLGRFATIVLPAGFAGRGPGLDGATFERLGFERPRGRAGRRGRLSSRRRLGAGSQAEGRINVAPSRRGWRARRTTGFRPRRWWRRTRGRGGWRLRARLGGLRSGSERVGQRGPWVFFLRHV